MLSDIGSKTIDAWGIRNRDATGRTAGIPYPGTYVIDSRGVIVSRDFEESYQERDTAASILARLDQSIGQASPEVLGRYLKVRPAATDRVAAPGHRLTLTAEVTPGEGIHVYAPGQTGYIPVGLTLAASADYRAHAVVFPQSSTYHFAPLNEDVSVYAHPFRLSVDVTLALTPSMRQRGAAHASLTIEGTLDYQACNDTVCFRPDSVPLTWTIGLLPIER